MRIICTTNDDKKAYNFSAFLTKEGIPNQCEASKDLDWGSAGYGQVEFRLWVYNEDDVDSVKALWDKFEKNPGDAAFQVERQPLKQLIEPSLTKWKGVSEPVPSHKRPHFLRRKTTGTLSVYLIVFCSLLFITNEINARWIKQLPKDIPYTVASSSDLKKQMLFDYPAAFDIADNLIVLYGIDALMEPKDLPAEGKSLLEKYRQTKYWKGLYHEVIVSSETGNAVLSYDGPLFEKIKDGQYWRLFTPALLHGDLLHLLFNMIWLAVLGTQMESRVGKLRYLLFIVVVAIVTNIAQYIMSGFNFLGFSGVVCGMLAFIWMRQKKAPWEGYRLHPSTIAFIAFFVLAMMALQSVSFLLEVYYDTTLPIGIANTAHITGGVIGALVGSVGLLNRTKG